MLCNGYFGWGKDREGHLNTLVRAMRKNSRTVVDENSSGEEAMEGAEESLLSILGARLLKKIIVYLNVVSYTRIYLL